MRGWGTAAWGTETWGAPAGPETLEDWFDQDAWDRVEEDGDIITLPVNPGEDPVSITVDASRRLFYRIEVTDEAGEKLGQVVNFWDAHYTAVLGEAAALRFTLLADDAAAALLVHPNHIVLRDRYGLVLDRFLPRKRKKRRVGDAKFLDIEAQSLIVALQRQPVISYSATATVQEHVAWLLQQQIGALVLGLGGIEEPIASTSVLLEVEACTVLQALNRLRELLPAADRGHMYVTAGNNFRWRKVIGPLGRQLLVGLNLRGIQYGTNDDDLITRLYMYGEGQDGAHRVRLTDAGEANEYIEQNTGTYGIVPFVKIDRRILNPATLLARAQAILSEFSTPRVEVTVDVWDLACADVQDGGPDYTVYGSYYVGSQLRAIDADLSIDTTITVAKAEYDLSNPLAVKLDLSNRQRSLADMFKEIYQQIPGPTNVNRDAGNTYENITRIYDGTEIDPVTGEASSDEYADLLHRLGDLKAELDRLSYRQTDITDETEGDALGGRWNDLVPSFEAATEAALPQSDIPQNSIGRVTAGDDAGRMYKRNAANDDWEPVGEAYWAPYGGA